MEPVYLDFRIEFFKASYKALIGGLLGYLANVGGKIIDNSFLEILGAGLCACSLTYLGFSLGIAYYNYIGTKSKLENLEKKLEKKTL
ncbi:MAG: hypothetical protein QW625_03075 [Candidatus Nanoarchaeia archaeon]